MTGILDAAVALEPEPPKKENVVAQLTDAIKAHFDLAHEAGRSYAIPKASAAEAGICLPPGVAVGWEDLKHVIVRYARTAKIATVTETMARTVLLQLKADAMDGEETELPLRFRHEDGGVVLDLGRADGKVVMISPDGWEVTAMPAGFAFRRTHAVKPLPIPEHQPGVTLSSLAPVLALDPESEEFRCLLGFQIGLAFAANVRPGVLLTGAPGSAKSTRLRLVASVVEPMAPDALGGAFGRNHGDDEVRALHRAVPLYDNLTQLSGATSDLLCCLITGTAREGRQLYTNDGISTAAIKRPVGLTAVATPAGLRPDALDRLIVIDLEPPEVRRSDGAVQDTFDAIHPGLLASWCDAVSAVLRWMPFTQEPGQYRMAAHAHVLAAIDTAVAAGHITCPAGLLDAYATNVRATRQRTAGDDVFGSALLTFMERQPVTSTAPGECGRMYEYRKWEGKSTDLLSQLAMASIMNLAEGGLRSPGWPSTPRAVPNVLNHLKGALAECGLTWAVRLLDGRNVYMFTLCNEKTG